MTAGLGAAAPVVSDAKPSVGRRGALGPGGFVTASDGTGLYVSDWGEGRPVVFLASLGLPSDMWDYQRLALSARGLRCIAYDRRGHGRSTGSGLRFDFDTLAGDLASVLDALDVRDVILIGHSISSGEMVRYISRYGAGRISGLAFISPAATPEVTQSATNPAAPTGEQFQAYLDGLIDAGFPVWIAENEAPFFVPDTPQPMREWIVQMMRRTSLRAYYGCTQTMAGVNFRDELKAIRLPTVVVHGDKDVSAPVERGRATASLIPGAAFTLYEGAPHGLFLTHKARLNSDLLRFAAH